MDREEVLLKEYEVAQHHINALNTQVWLATSIFLSINSGALAYVFKQGQHGVDGLLTVSVIGTILILILHFWKRWIKRVQFLHLITFHRMRQIEEALGLWKNRLVDAVDAFFDDSKKKSSEAGKKLEEKYKYVKPAGFTGLQWISRLLMIGWGFLIIREFSIYFGILEWLQNKIGV